MKSNVNIEKEKLDSYFIIELCILSKQQSKLKKKLQFTFILFLLNIRNWHHLNIYTETRSFEQIRSNSNKFKLFRRRRTYYEEIRKLARKHYKIIMG